MITYAAGAIELWASLAWERPAEVPSKNLLPMVSGAVKPLLAESPGTDEAMRFVAGEIRGFDPRSTAQALDDVLRTLTSKAALSEAVLETRVLRQAPPWVARGTLVGEVSCRLWDAGFSVTFGRSWEPVADADLAIGVGGSAELEELFKERFSWETTPRHR